MSHDGKRLEKFREALPREKGRPVPARSLALALKWEEARWRNLERAQEWSSSQRALAASGAEAIAALLDAPEDARNSAVSFVRSGEGALGALGSAMWRGPDPARPATPGRRARGRSPPRRGPPRPAARPTAPRRPAPARAAWGARLRRDQDGHGDGDRRCRRCRGRRARLLGAVAARSPVAREVAPVGSPVRSLDHQP